jgi:hypothetical protein
MTECENCGGTGWVVIEDCDSSECYPVDWGGHVCMTSCEDCNEGSAM